MPACAIFLVTNQYSCDQFLQILAGNARKVSAVRFERINSGDESVEANGVTRLVPKLMKRKYSSDDESDRTMSNGGEVRYHEMANDCVMSVQEDNLDQVNRQ